MDECMFPDKKPSRRAVDDGSGELFPVAPKKEPQKSKLPLPTLSVPAGTQGKKCGCGATIYLVEQPSGRWAPVTCGVPGGRVPSAKEAGIGISHFIDCPQSDRYPRSRR